MTNETIQGLKRVSWLPDRDATDNGTLIAGQEYYDVEFTGGSITGITPSQLPTPLAIADGGTGQVTANSALNALLPLQTGHANEVLKTNGTDASWSADIDTGITQLTGDVTAGPGSGSQAATLATVNANVGSFGSSTSIPSFTVNAKGLITAASGNAVIAPSGTLTGTTLAANVVTSSLTSVGTIGTGTWQGTAVGVLYGGTGQTSYTDGQILIGNTTGNTLAKATLTGTSNQIVVTNGSGSITLSTPQNIATTSTPQFARLGLGQAADSSAVMAATGQYFSAIATTTVTLDWNSGNAQQITLASGGQVFTFANPKSGARYILKLKQPAGGAAGTVTWPGTVLWPGGVAPTLTTTNSKTDIVSFFYDGTNYFGAANLNF